MKRIFIIVLLLGLGVFPVFSQVAIGVRGGGHVANFDGSYERLTTNYDGEEFFLVSESLLRIRDEQSDFIFGYQGGINFRIRLNSRLDFSPDLSFYVVGNNLSYELDSLGPVLDEDVREANLTALSSVEETIRLSYLNVPLLFRYNFDFGLNLQLGPYFAFRLQQAQNYKETFEDGRAAIDLDFKADNFKVAHEVDGRPRVNRYLGTDMGFVGGIGYSFPSLNLGVDLRYQRSFFPVINTRISERSRRSSTHVQHSVGLSVVYYFYNSLN